MQTCKVHAYDEEVTQPEEEGKTRGSIVVFLKCLFVVVSGLWCPHANRKANTKDHHHWVTSPWVAVHQRKRRR
eukprot:6584520-Pyramimonas_sp.AAC.1